MFITLFIHSFEMLSNIKHTIMKLLIKGAYYYDRDNDMILVPHFTGEYFIVDCIIFKRMDELKGSYDEDYIESVIDNPITLDGKDYFTCESNPVNVNDWNLLSDLSELEHIEEDFNF